MFKHGLEAPKLNSRHYWKHRKASNSSLNDFANIPSGYDWTMTAAKSCSTTGYVKISVTHAAKKIGILKGVRGVAEPIVKRQLQNGRGRALIFMGTKNPCDESMMLHCYGDFHQTLFLFLDRVLKTRLVSGFRNRAFPAIEAGTQPVRRISRSLRRESLRVSSS